MNLNRFLLALSLLLMSTVTNAQNQKDMNIFKTSYDRSWEKVESFINDDTPRSAIKEAEKIYKRAASEKNFPQLTRAGLTLMAMRHDISPDSAVVDVEQLEQLVKEREAKAATPRDWAEVALLHTLTASVYDRWKYSNLTRSDDEAGDRVVQRMKEHVEAATAHAQDIAGVSVEDCRPLLEQTGRDSRLYNYDALSLVADFLEEESYVDREQRWQLFKRCADAYKAKGMREAEALMRLRELDEQSSLDSYSLRLTRAAHAEKLRVMVDEFGDTEVAPDVYLDWMSETRFEHRQDRLEAARAAMSRWPKSELYSRFERIAMDCLAPSLSLYMSAQEGGLEMAGKPMSVRVHHSNIGDADLVVRRLRPKAKQKEILFGEEDVKNLVETETVWQQHLSFDAHKQHPELAEDSQTDTLFVTLPPGRYRISLEGGGRKSEEIFQLSSIQVMAASLPGAHRIATVVDSRSGYPVAGCEVIGMWRRYEDKFWKTYSKTYVSDANGQVVLDNGIETVAARLTPDDESKATGIDREKVFEIHPTPPRQIYKAFTDRAIYRPGQTVYVSGFVYRRNGEQTEAQGDMPVIVELRDANWQLLQKTELKTDALGSASTDFVLPTDRLNGTWRIKFGDTQVEFRVEEYKRPTFTVEMEDTQGQFSLGDTIEVTGVAKTYSGVPVQGAKVDFDISLRKSTYWSWYLRGVGWKKVETGEVVTDDDGRFRIKLFLDDDLVRKSSDMNADVREVDGHSVVYDFDGLMQYQVAVKVTDLGGETHEAERTVQVGAREFDLSIDAPKLIDRAAEVPDITVKAANAQGQEVQAEGTYRLLKYNQDTSTYDIEVATGTFSTQQPLQLPSLMSYELGNYRIELCAQDSREHTIKTNSYFVVWDSKKGGMMNLQKDWLHTSTDVLKPGESVDVWYAVEKADAYTFLYVVTNEDVLIEKRAVVNPTQQHLRITYKSEYGEGLRFYLAYVKDGRLHTLEQSFVLQRPEKKLKLAWTTFRDRLTPGQQETWTLRVVNKDGKPVPASVMATMYDASLDFFVRHSWPFSLYFSRTVPSIGNYLSSLGGVPSLSLSFVQNYPEVYVRTFNQLRPFGDYDSEYASSNVSVMRALGGAPVLLESRAMMKNSSVGSPLGSAVAVEDAMAAEEVAEAGQADGQNTDNGESTVQLRENFNETAFFEPSLLTDKDGSVSISFTLPDCLTEWRVMTLAHTAVIDYGQLESTVVARKEFMVQPNMPRFVRQGDHMSIATKIINTSEQALSGDAVIRLLDPESGKVVMTRTLPFSVGAGQTTSVSFDYDVPEEYPMFVCEISGQAAGFSDGERNYLPVLSSRRYITETVPFYIEEPGTKTLDLSTLFNNHSETATQRRMTFEYTDNPSWQAILALHSVVTPRYDDAVDWSASLYANRVALSIGQRMPRLLELIMKWNAEDNAEGTLTSELQKNQELKEILLQESPWMLDAQDETEQRHKLCELFDTQLLNRRITAAKKKLKDLQFGSGGWSWFRGMEPSYYITLSVSEHMAQLLNYLRTQGEEDKEVLDMLHKSIQYLDMEELEYYNKYGKKDKKSLPSESTFRYLYMRSLVPEALKSDKHVDAMKKFYLDKTEKKVKQLTMYGRANVAVVFYDDHRDAAADKFVQSLHEYTVTRQGMGRYFDTDKASYSWCDYRIPTHIAAMKAFQASLKKNGENAPDGLCQDDLLQMQLWLLRQKQTQKWDNVLNTLAVADLLLTIDPETTFHEAQLPTVSLGGQPVQLSAQSAGLGYTKTPVPETMIDAAEAVVTKTSPGISWGCVYGQCLESLDRMQKTEGELTVDRKAYVETPTGWRELQPDDVLNIGDKVRLRHIVTSDRDMDFVQVRSQYAACLEPLRQLSGYQWLGGRGCYLAMHDAAADLFFDRFRKGTSTLDLEFYVTRTGHYSLGIATVQCAYTPAFSGHSDGRSLDVKE